MIGITVAMIAYLFLIPANSVLELKSLRIVFGIWGLFVVYDNLRGWLTAACPK
jgi:hypothetical protein